MKDLLYTYKINATLYVIYLGKEITDNLTKCRKDL